MLNIENAKNKDRVDFVLLRLLRIKNLKAYGGCYVGYYNPTLRVECNKLYFDIINELGFYL